LNILTVCLGIGIAIPLSLPIYVAYIRWRRPSEYVDTPTSGQPCPPGLCEPSRARQLAAYHANLIRNDEEISDRLDVLRQADRRAPKIRVSRVERTALPEGGEPLTINQRIKDALEARK
jgi:hypothetical protein